MTLVELLTVMAVLAILSSIAVASYRSYMMRTNRTDARTALLRIQVAEEKYFLQNDQYIADAVSAPPAGLGILGAGGATPSGYYTIAVTPGATANIATSYLATATAVPGGPQAQDTAVCQTLSIDDQGQRLPPESSGCWR